jgi:hypothetical protein
MESTENGRSVSKADAEADCTVKNAESATQPMVAKTTEESFMASLVSAAGYILAVSYPVLALSTGARAIYQLFFKEDVTYYAPSLMSGVAALSYLVAAIGFAYRRRWSWWLSVAALGFETSMSVIVGIWSYVDPATIGSTVWRHFGEDYGYFPFFQPIIGLRVAPH